MLQKSFWLSKSPKFSSAKVFPVGIITIAGATGPGVHYLKEDKEGWVGGGPGVTYRYGVSLSTAIEGSENNPKSLFLYWADWFSIIRFCNLGFSYLSDINFYRGIIIDWAIISPILGSFLSVWAAVSNLLKTALLIPLLYSSCRYGSDTIYPSFLILKYC